MSAESVRYGAQNKSDPVIHELLSLALGGGIVFVRVAVRRTESGEWRGRIVFGKDETESGLSTAEILYADCEADFWQCVRDLNVNHIKDLYRSVSG